MRRGKGVKFMDITKYIEKRDLGLAEVIKAGGGYALAFKRWSADSGEQEEPEIQAVDLDALTKQKKDLQGQIDDIEALKADITTLK